MNNAQRKRICKIADALNELKSQIDELYEEEHEAFENIPESLQNDRSCSPSGNGQTTPSTRSFSPRPRTRSAFVICLRQMAGQRQQCGSP